jgi:hypothetical protein
MIPTNPEIIASADVHRLRVPARRRAVVAVMTRLSLPALIATASMLGALAYLTGYALVLAVL